MKKIIIHIANIELSEEIGMGRVACYWKKEFEKKGYEFIHIGKKETGKTFHRIFFPYAAYHAYRKLKKKASLFLIHEPSAAPFLNKDIPVVVFSHGLERRWWQLALNGKAGETIKLKSRIIFPFSNLRSGDAGLKKANLILLNNKEDQLFTQDYYGRKKEATFIFKNGVYNSGLNEKIQPPDNTILFLGSWLKRKGIVTLVEAAKIIYSKGLNVKWILAGTGLSEENVLSLWPEEIRKNVEVSPFFRLSEEKSFLARSNIFVLPSFYEGQPLALLQAMESGRCCITTNSCGQKDLITDNNNGLLFETGDCNKLAELIIFCLKNKKLRLRLGRNARYSVINRKWDKVSCEIVKKVGGVINNPGKIK